MSTEPPSAKQAGLERTYHGDTVIDEYAWLADKDDPDTIAYLTAENAYAEAATAAPLVALHFGQINLWSVVTGIIALPFVGIAMVAGALQLFAGLFWSTAAAAISPTSMKPGG